MTLLAGFAVYFIIWWVTLLAVLPIGVRTQADARDIAPGTAESAPVRPRIGVKLLQTTLTAAALFAVYYVVTAVFGFTVDSIPAIVPDFSGR